MIIRPYPASNLNYGLRKGCQIDLIVLHTMEGSLVGTARWFKNDNAGCSAHYGIGSDGTVLQFVEEMYNAWHCGNPGFNRRSIGIELEGFCKDPRAFTVRMIDALVELLMSTLPRYKIPADRQHIIGHNEVPDPRGRGGGGRNHHQDPGEHCPWDSIMRRLNPGAV